MAKPPFDQSIFNIQLYRMKGRAPNFTCTEIKTLTTWYIFHKISKVLT